MPRGLAKLITQLTGEDWISRAIDGYYDRAYPERWDEPNLEIHPSGAGSLCSREIQLHMLGYRSATPSRNRRRMDNGTYSHDRWNRDLEEVGLLAHKNRRIVLQGDMEWSGEVDIILQHPITGSLHLGEIKTMNERRWRAVPEQVTNRYAMARLLLQTERKYVRQLAHYYHIHRASLPLDPECFYLFENTNTQEYKIRYVSFDQELIDDAFKNPLEAQRASKEGRLLPAPYARKSPICKECWISKLCYAEQDGDERVTEWLKQQLVKTKTESGTSE